MQCIQLVLRKQVYVLIHQKGFPEELEVRALILSSMLVANIEVNVYS